MTSKPSFLDQACYCFPMFFSTVYLIHTSCDQEVIFWLIFWLNLELHAVEKLDVELTRQKYTKREVFEGLRKQLTYLLPEANSQFTSSSSRHSLEWFYTWTEGEGLQPPVSFAWWCSKQHDEGGTIQFHHRDIASPAYKQFHFSKLFHLLCFRSIPDTEKKN